MISFAKHLPTCSLDVQDVCVSVVVCVEVLKTLYVCACVFVCVLDMYKCVCVCLHTKYCRFEHIFA